MSVEFWADSERWGASDQWRHEESNREEQVLAVVGPNPSKVRTSYSVYHLKEQRPEAASKDDALLQGNTYVIDATQTPMAFADPQGEAVTHEEQERLGPQYAHLGKDEPIAERLSRGQWQVGQWYSLHQGLFRAFLGADKGQYERGRVRISRLHTLDGLPVADFEWTAEMTSQEQGGMEVGWQIRGTATVASRPTQVLKNDLEAELNVSGKTRKDGQWIRIAGEGTVSDTTEYTAWR